jgi:hypothetical protein
MTFDVILAELSGGCRVLVGGPSTSVNTPWEPNGVGLPSLSELVGLPEREGHDHAHEFLRARS